MTNIRYQPVGLPESKLQGIFDPGQTVYTLYRVVLQVEDRIMAGTPSDPDIVQNWLSSKMGITDEHELLALTAQTMNESGVTEAQPGMTMEQLREVAEQYARQKGTNVFKRDDVGIYLESRCFKAALKEYINSLYAHVKTWGLTGKSAKAMAAERVHIKQNKLYLCQPEDPYSFDESDWETGVTPMKEPSGVETFVGHTNGPRGPQSNLTRVEYATQPRIYLTLAVAEDFIGMEHWARIAVHGQEIGFGSLRSQGQGKFKIIQFSKVFQGDEMPKRTEKTKGKAERNGSASAEEAVAALN